jgi:hypothetical protein
LQLYPPKNALLDSTAGEGVCEKDEAWNMHRPKGGVLRGLGRWEDFGRRVKGECIGEYRRPRGKKLTFKVPSRMPGTGIL